MELLSNAEGSLDIGVGKFKVRPSGAAVCFCPVTFTCSGIIART